MRHRAPGWVAALVALAVGAVSVSGPVAAMAAPRSGGHTLVFSGALAGPLTVKPPPNSACYTIRARHTFTLTLEGRVRGIVVLLSVTVSPYAHPHTYTIRPVPVSKGIPVELSVEGGSHAGPWVPSRKGGTLALAGSGRSGRLQLRLRSPVTAGSITVAGSFVCPDFVSE